MGTEGITNNADEIQASAYVSSQSLLSTSIPSSPNSAPNNNQVGSRRSSKSRLNGEQIIEGHYEGNMERFFQSEVRPVYFGNNQKY